MITETDKIISIHNIMPTAKGAVVRYDQEKTSGKDIQEIKVALSRFAEHAQFPILVIPENLRVYSVDDLERMREIANELIDNAVKEKK